jgi:integrase
MNAEGIALPPELLSQIAGFLFDPCKNRIVQQNVRPLRDHLLEYREGLIAKADTAKHVRDTVRRARLILRLCRATQWAHLTPTAIIIAVNKLRASRPRRASFGLATVNHYIQSMKAFCSWMVSDYRAERSPCLSLRPYNARTDVRRPRRPLTADEVLRLIDAANKGPVIASIPGHERALMYVLACTTGLRANELETLTSDSFQLAGDSPTVTVAASYSKHRRTDVVPLRADVAELVRAYLAITPRSTKLFRRPSGNGTRALQVDLAAAGIPYCLNGRWADMHAQRHTFVSNLFETGATPKEAQTLARHSDARMTLAVYAHTQTTKQRAAVERLPAPVPRLGK